MPLRQAPGNICVVRLSAIGDACHALAVVRAVQDRWPETAISWIIGRTEATLMAGVDGVEFITFDKRKGLRAYGDVHRKLVGRQFDVALCMHASLRANLLTALIPSPLKIGFDLRRARDLQWLFTGERIREVPGQHALEAMLEFARAIGAGTAGPRWNLPLTRADREFAAAHREAGRPLLVMSPLSSQRSRNFRNWRAERYAAVADHAFRRYRARVLLTGGDTGPERDYAREIRAHSAADLTDLVGATTLTQLAALIEAADLVVCPDSGPAHIGTAVGTPVVGLYASSNPDRTGPYLSRAWTVNRYPDAVRRYLGRDVASIRFGRRVRHPDVMDLIEISDVTDKIDSILG